MIINVTLTDEEKKTINDAINILFEYHKCSNETGAAYMDTLTTINGLTEWLNERL